MRIRTALFGLLAGAGALVGCEDGMTGVGSYPAIDPGRIGHCEPNAKATSAVVGEVCVATRADARATAVGATLLDALPVTIADTGEVTTGANTVGSGALRAGVVAVGSTTANVDTKDDVSLATASTTGLSLVVAGIGIGADVLDATARVSCEGREANATVSNLRVAGRPVTVTGAPNQTVVIGPLTIVINERIENGETVTSRALHVKAATLLGKVAEVKVATARASATCTCSAAEDGNDANDGNASSPGSSSSSSSGGGSSSGGASGGASSSSSSGASGGASGGGNVTVCSATMPCADGYRCVY